MLDGTLPVGVAPNGGASATAATMLRVYAGHLSEPRRITDASNNLRWSWDADPFGVGAANNNPAAKGIFNDDMRFPGQLFDSENNTHYNVTRSYDPARGRYLQSDIFGLAGGINTYVYVFSRPTVLVDLQGAAGIPVGSTFFGVYPDQMTLSPEAIAYCSRAGITCYGNYDGSGITAKKVLSTYFGTLGLIAGGVALTSESVAIDLLGQFADALSLENDPSPKGALLFTAGLGASVPSTPYPVKVGIYACKVIDFDSSTLQESRSNPTQNTSQ